LCGIYLVKHNEDLSSNKETNLAEDFERDEYNITSKFFSSKKDVLTVMGKILDFYTKAGTSALLNNFCYYQKN
jgi:hypothetical protein